MQTSVSHGETCASWIHRQVPRSSAALTIVFHMIVDCGCAEGPPPSKPAAACLQIPTPYPTAIFIREKAIVVNLSSIRMIIDAGAASAALPACACAIFLAAGRSAGRHRQYKNACHHHLSPHHSHVSAVLYTTSIQQHPAAANSCCLLLKLCCQGARAGSLLLPCTDIVQVLPMGPQR